MNQRLSPWLNCAVTCVPGGPVWTRDHDTGVDIFSAATKMTEVD